MDGRNQRRPIASGVEYLEFSGGPAASFVFFRARSGLGWVSVGFRAEGEGIKGIKSTGGGFYLLLIPAGVGRAGDCICVNTELKAITG